MDRLKLREIAENGLDIREMPLRVAFYARVSTDTDEQLNSLANQSRYFADFIKSSSSWTFAGGYVDEGISGTSVDGRIQFQKMIDDAHAGKFDYIITKEISRFSRNTLDSIKYTRELLECGVGVLFQNDKIDTLAPDAELRLTIMASIAQDEVRRISERVRFGCKRAQENGIVLGTSNIYGYIKNNGRLEADPAQAETVKKIFSMYAEGSMGLRRIAKALASDGIMSPCGKMFTYGTLAGIIRNPKYKGFYAGKKYVTDDYRFSGRKKLRTQRSDWIVYPDEDIEPIVSPEIWQKANDILDIRGKKSREHADSSQNRYVYSGKLVCAIHNTSFHRHVYKNRSGDRECWNCRIYRLHGRDSCPLPTIYTSELDDIMRKIYSSVCINREKIKSQLTDIYAGLNDRGTENLKLSDKKRELEKIERKKSSLLELYSDGIINKEDFKNQNDPLNLTLNSVRNEISMLENKISDYSFHSREKELSSSIDRFLSGSENGIILDSTNRALLDKITVGMAEDGKISLDVLLSTGQQYERFIDKSDKKNKKTDSFSGIPPCESGISQAQVSRLEKNALEKIRKDF